MMKIIWALILLVFVILVGIFFAYKVGFDVIWIAIITFILSILYSKFTYCGLGEIAIGIIFCPLLYNGIYYVMTSHYSQEIFWLSLTVMPILIGVLYNHTMLDFDFDSNHNKITLCSLLKSRQKAFKLFCLLELLP